MGILILVQKIRTSILLTLFYELVMRCYLAAAMTSVIGFCDFKTFDDLCMQSLFHKSKCTLGGVQ